jgi:hypothetical protein
MHFAIIARDDPAEATLALRLAKRAEHLERVHAMKADGRIVDGGAMLDEAGSMVGSVMLCEFADRAAVDAYLANEIYNTAGIWKSIEIIPLLRVSWRN